MQTVKKCITKPHSQSVTEYFYQVTQLRFINGHATQVIIQFDFLTTVSRTNRLTGNAQR